MLSPMAETGQKRPLHAINTTTRTPPKCSEVFLDYFLRNRSSLNLRVLILPTFFFACLKRTVSSVQATTIGLFQILNSRP